MNTDISSIAHMDFDGQLHHIALVTEDLSASVQGLLAMGAALLPPVPAREVSLQEVYRGRPFIAAKTIEQVKVKLGDLVIEVFAPNQLPSPWREGVDAKGAGLHHVGYAVDDVRSSLQKQLERGAELICHVSFNGEIRACYFKPKDVDLVVEFIKPAPQRS